MITAGAFILGVLGLVIAPMTEAHPVYPAHWWAKVQDMHPPAWEVLPDAAKPNVEVILSKRNELGILSNFSETPFTLQGKSYRSIEGFWQMMFYPENAEDPRAKFSGIPWPHSREEVSQMVGFEAKAAGDLGFENQKKIGIDWVSFEGKHFKYWTPDRGEQYELILAAMRAKLAQNPKVKEILLSTRDLILLPDHHQPEDAPPSWRYCTIWMQLRQELLKQKH